MNKLSCTITGHSPQRFMFKYNEVAPLCWKIKAALLDQIKVLHKKGIQLFYVGCAVGVDTWAAEIILELKNKNEFSNIELFCAISFPEQSDTYTNRQKKRYNKIINQCDHKKIISNYYSPVVYKRRNYFMIDHSQYLLAVYDQDKTIRSGMSTMVNYATKKKLNMIFLHPDTAEISV